MNYHYPNDNREILLVSSPETAEKVNQIKEHLSTILTQSVATYEIPYNTFSDSAHNTEFKTKICGKHVFIYADCYSDDPSWDLPSKYMFTRQLLSACQSNRVASNNIIYPCYPYSRSDKEEDVWWNGWNKIVSIMAPRVLDDAHRHWVETFTTLDIHNQAVLSRGWIKTPNQITNLGYRRMIDYALKQLDPTNTEIGSTDEWWTKKISGLAQVLGLNNYIAFKSRDNTVANSVKQLFVEKWFAEIAWKDIIVYDDMIDTWWTICLAVEQLKKKWAKSITIVSPHWMFNNDAIEKLERLYTAWDIRSIIISDTITRSSLPSWITVLKTNRLFANTIASLLNEQEVNINDAWELN